MNSLCLKYGLVSDNSMKGFAKVNFDEDSLVSDWMPVLVRKSKSDKESWQLEINEHVACLILNGCDEGVIIGVLPSDEDPADPGEGPGKFRKLFSDGTLIEYDKGAHKMTVDLKGELNAKMTGKAVIEAVGDIAAKSGANASIEAVNVDAKATAAATVEAPVINLKGNVIVAGSLTAASIATTGGGSITSTGDFVTEGQVQAAEVIAGGISLRTHRHGGVQTGSQVTGQATS